MLRPYLNKVRIKSFIPSDLEMTSRIIGKSQALYGNNDGHNNWEKGNPKSSTGGNLNGESIKNNALFLPAEVIDVAGSEKKYFDNLFRIKNPIAGRLLPIGPLIHRKNSLLSEISDVYIRDCYEDLYDKHILNDPNMSHIFVTGTPGIGKSVFRSFVLWKQIQKARENRENCVFCLGKSPRDSSSSYYIVMREGEIVQMKEDMVKYQLEITRAISISMSGYRLYSHIDVSKGNSGNTLSMEENHMRIYYTSPNEEAWKEENKLFGTVLCLPVWTLEELTDFYLTIGGNEVLINALIHEENRVIPERVSTKLFSLDPKYENGKLKFVRFTAPDGSKHSVSGEYFIRTIKIEADKYGYVPRNLFLSLVLYTDYIKRIDTAVMESNETIVSVNAFDSTATPKIRHRLAQIQPPKDSVNKKFLFDKPYVPSWLGSFVITKIITRVIKQYSLNLETNFFFNDVGNNIKNYDAKLMEILVLGCFALAPNHFLATGISQPSVFSNGKIVPKEIDTKLIDTIVHSNSTSPNICSLPNEEFERVASNTNQIGMASPLNQFYPGIDGVAHFTTKKKMPKEQSEGREEDGTYDERVTAFFQVTISRKHEFGKEATENLNALIKKIEANAKENKFSKHRIVFFWLGKRGDSGKSCPDNKLNRNIKRDMEHYHITLNLNKITDAQSNSRAMSNSV